MAVVLTLVQTNQIRITIRERNNTKTVQTIQNTINTSTQITKTLYITKPTHTHTHTLQNKLKQPQLFGVYFASDFN